ncbi:hypothetical protein Acor_03360 [Acrocarpospora corrugata]|uniref:DUF202 domain-containing protein n=1 Tax=Acrocarpospora corrugata TaxID=35763 RepID=A0A5M3VNB5_9ACTN|nr:DUF202 domain-containing protein [Acrocarpospora corrugata]GER98274.1 hypothetical protein Acor_03360 [Acrocarpospora corrugata]
MIGGPGLQSERTRLAWVRTATALATLGLGGGGAALRHDAGPVTGVLFLLAALTGAVLLARTGLRFQRVQRALRDGLPLHDTFDALLAWAGTLAVVAGSGSLVVTLF